ncbi:hypothetical protein P43SY_011200 [Pythium insidiosum]|uniref:Uncharacterized protein n=1 Tax=Pythium insidiosum TaxID=114742 RepID=A0AAD5LRR0_PYTIN|nr:hypothetical protein P43SY_011200 [Pythium insidiosum]
MTELIASPSKTVCDVKSVQVMGSLFQHLADDDVKQDSETTKLIDFKSHRFTGLTQVIKRVLLKWTALQAWYTEHAAHRMSKGKEPKYFFLLEDHKIDLQQLLSIFEPLTHVSCYCEAFHQSFFKRYTDKDEISTCSYLFEMALFLHPRYKAFESKIGPLVRLCNVQRAVASPHAVARDVEVAIRDRVKDALRLLSPDDCGEVVSSEI